MADTDSPFAGNQMGIQAGPDFTELRAPTTNAAEQLASSLAQATPVLQGAMDQYGQFQQRKMAEQAKRDALITNGAGLADAVRAGTIKPTQNPWYMEAYHREAAAVRTKSALADLQDQSSTWQSKSDPVAFQKQWNEEVGKIGQGFASDPWTLQGFNAAASPVTSQVIQQNTAENVQRIETERKNNLTQLAADALSVKLRDGAGYMTANDAYNALTPARQQWYATGGNDTEWHQLLQNAVTSAAQIRRDPNLLKLLGAPELLYGPSKAGDTAIYGSGLLSGPLQDHPTVAPAIPTPGEAAPAPGAPAGLTVKAPVVTKLPMPVQGAITSGFGQRTAPIEGASTNHKGIDIAAPGGTPVSAQATGKVVFAGKDGGLGNAIKVDYGNGVVATYGHLSAVSVSEGDVVAAGQAVGNVGRTGIATGNHLHYQLEVNGKPVDPQTFNGQVGGHSIPTTQQAPQQPPSSGFPGTDRPYQASTQNLPGNNLARGPSLLEMPGVAGQADQSAFWITRAAEEAPIAALNILKAQRESRGYAASDDLAQQFGTGLLSGTVSQAQMTDYLHSKGYSVPEIGLALGQVHQQLVSSVGVQSAVMEAKTQDPTKAAAILALTREGATNGSSPAYFAKVESALKRGDITAEVATQMTRTAIDRSNTQFQMGLETDRDARQKQDDVYRIKFDKYRELEDGVQGRAGAGLAYMGKLIGDPQMAATLTSDPKELAKLNAVGKAASLAWIDAHPDDFDGALTAATRAVTQTVLSNPIVAAGRAMAGKKKPQAK